MHQASAPPSRRNRAAHRHRSLLKTRDISPLDEQGRGQVVIREPSAVEWYSHSTGPQPLARPTAGNDLMFPSVEDLVAGLVPRQASQWRTNYSYPHATQAASSEILDNVDLTRANVRLGPRTMTSAGSVTAAGGSCIGERGATHQTDDGQPRARVAR
jgi:hypothetical protein